MPLALGSVNLLITMIIPYFHIKSSFLNEKLHIDMRGFRNWLEAFDYESHPSVPRFVQTKLDRNDKFKVLVIDVKKFDEAWSKDTGMYLPPGGSGDNYIPIYRQDKPEGYNRYHRASEDSLKFKQADKDFDMPTVGLRFGLPSFTDGRHRFAYFRDLGIKTLPISVPVQDYPQMKMLFGA